MRRNGISTLLCIQLAALLLGPLPAQAAQLFFNEGDFLAALPGGDVLTVEDNYNDFTGDALSIGTLPDGLDRGDYIVKGINTPNGALFGPASSTFATQAVTDPASSFLHIFVADELFPDDDSLYELIFDEPISGFSMLARTVAGNAALDYQPITVGGVGESVEFTPPQDPPNPPSTFFGFVFDTPQSVVTFAADTPSINDPTRDIFNVDDLRAYGAPVSVPVPGTAWLMLTLGALGWRGFRRRTATPA